MVELRLVGDGGEAPPTNGQLVNVLEEYLELAHRGEIHSIAVVGCGEDQLHTSAYGHDIILCGALDALKHQLLEQALVPM
jgi:hypothetical protein